MPQNLPNLLTGLRIVAIPLMVVCYYLPQPISTVGAAVVFIVAAVTDWFDGWVARRMGQTSQLLGVRFKVYCQLSKVFVVAVEHS